MPSLFVYMSRSPANHTEGPVSICVNLVEPPVSITQNKGCCYALLSFLLLIQKCHKVLASWQNNYNAEKSVTCTDP